MRDKMPYRFWKQTWSEKCLSERQLLKKSNVHILAGWGLEAARAISALSPCVILSAKYYVTLKQPLFEKNVFGVKRKFIFNFQIRAE